MASSNGRGTAGGGAAGPSPAARSGERAAEAPVAPQRRSVDALDAALLDEICAINAAGVDLLVQQATEAVAPRAGAGPAKPAVVLPPGPSAQAWLELDAPQRRRLAAQPMLLFGIGFEDGARWQALSDGVLAADAPRRIAESWPRPAPVQYARLLVHYAWHLARTAPLTAGLVAGMAGASAAALRACHVEHLDVLADRSAQWLRPRWLDAPCLWNDLLRVARAEANAGLARSVALRAVQRAGAALAAAAASAPAAAAASAPAPDSLIHVRAQAGGGKMPPSL